VSKDPISFDNILRSSSSSSGAINKVCYGIY